MGHDNGGVGMFIRTVTLALSFIVAGSGLRAQESDPSKALAAARSLHCDFPSGGTAVLTDPNPHYRPGHGVEGVFDAIDRKQGTARLIGNVGAGDVQLIVGSETLAFLEKSLAGYPQLTVVFARFRPHTREFVASDSRNAITVTGQVLVEQYYGSCVVLE
jgi:hypothetical protein